MRNRAFVLHFFFLYFFIQCVPLDPKYYAAIFSLPWRHLRYEDIFTIAHYSPRFVSGSATSQSFADWGVILLLSLLGAGIWTYRDRNRQTDEKKQQYWIRAIVRYRLAI